MNTCPRNNPVGFPIAAPGAEVLPPEPVPRTNLRSYEFGTGSAIGVRAEGSVKGGAVRRFITTVVGLAIGLTLFVGPAAGAAPAGGSATGGASSVAAARELPPVKVPQAPAPEAKTKNHVAKAPTSTTKSKKKKKKKKSKTGLFVIIGIVVLVVLAGVLFLFLRRK